MALTPETAKEAAVWLLAKSQTDDNAEVKRASELLQEEATRLDLEQSLGNGDC